MITLKVLTLKGCSYCDTYKQLLDLQKIKYLEICCSDDSNCKWCDSVEDVCKSELYPMTIINNHHLLCMTDNYTLLGKSIKSNHYTVNYFRDSSSIYNHILTIIKK
jgi:glutaredoxin